MNCQLGKRQWYGTSLVGCQHCTKSRLLFIYLKSVILRGYIASCMRLALHRMTALLDIAVSHHVDHRLFMYPVSQSRFPVLLPMINVADLYQCLGMDRIITLLP